jgi:hypothetical protein
VSGFIAICSNCFLFGSSYLYLFYGALVGALSFFRLHKVGDAVATSSVSQDKLPPMPGELGFFQLRISIQAQILAALIVRVLSFEFFRNVVEAVVRFIRIAFLMKDNPSFFRSLWRYLKLYLVIVPIPAAILRPVLHAERDIDFQLIFAALTMIFINALGDVISIRLFLRNFESLRFDGDEFADSSATRFWRNARNEARYYFTVAKGGAYSLVVLIAVLMISSVLFGVQTGQFDLEFSEKCFTAAWHRMIIFPDLIFEPYWYKGQPAAFVGKGIPGLFLYGIITFIPIIVLFILAILWLFLLPLRLAITLPGNTILRIVSSEFAVLALCITVKRILHLNFLGLLTVFQT